MSETVLHARHVLSIEFKIYMYKQEFAFKASNVSNASNRAMLHQASVIPLRVSQGRVHRERIQRYGVTV